jgi:ankyrin repeat protein
LTFSITYHDGQKEQFALQLKHRKAENLDAIKELEIKKQRKNDFIISDYCASFEKLTTTVQTDYTFILFTNVKFQKIDEIKIYKTKRRADPFKVKVFNTDNIYQFQDTKSQSKFYKQFYLLSGQENVQGMEKRIDQFFHSDSNTATCYIDFFAKVRKWNYINTEITRDEVILKLTTLLLSNHIMRNFREQQDDKSKQLEKAIQQFDVTLIQDIDQRFVKDKWCYSHREKDLVKWARDNKMLPKQSKDDLNEEEKQLLHYLMQNLVFVNVTTSSEDVVYKVVNLSRSAENFKLKFVLIGKEVKDKFALTGKKTENQNFGNWKIFENLAQLESNQRLYYDMMISIKISLQGRNTECLETLRSKFNLRLDQFITPDVLFQMLEDDLVVGTAIEKLSEYNIIPRILRKAAFSYKHLGTICERNTVIVECSGKSETFRKLLNDELGNLTTLDLNRYQQNQSDYKKSAVVLTDQKLSYSNHSVICLQLIQHNKLAWSDHKIKEEDLNISDKEAKVIFGSPGIGKTVMMKRFANKCPLKYWVVMVSLTQDISFLKNKQTTADVLQQFVISDKKIDQQVIKYFQTLKQILFLFDGLDELDNENIKIVIDVVKRLIEEGYQILIFGRTYLKEMLTTELQIYFAYEIEELKKEDIKKYIHRHLTRKQIETKRFEMITGKILENHTEEIDGNILKVPLYLFIVLEIVSGSTNRNSLKEIPSVSEMYRRFIEGRLQHNLAKAKCDYADKSNIVMGIFERYYLREYQIAALKSYLDPNVLDRLNISPDTYFVKLIKDRGDFLGLVTEINRSDTFVFYHHTFAEYFAALWLSENIEKLSHEERILIFEQKYNRVRNFFDTELAKNCPLHQAILKQDIVEVEKLAADAEDYLNQRDRIGRTPLHLASSLGPKYPIKENFEIRNNQNTESTKILQCLLNMDQIDPLQKDKLFQWNCFEYADASLCLLALEELSKKKQFQMGHLTNYRNVNILCNHCVCLGCINILSILIKFEGLSNLDKLEKPLLHLAIEYGQNKVIQLLLDNNAHLFRTCSEGRTALHEAVIWGHFDILRILLNMTKKDCRRNSVLQFDINEKDGRGNAPLQFAAEYGYFDIVKLLIEKGAQVNTTNKFGKTPLHKAACMHNRNTVEHLINNDANPNVQDNEGLTVLQEAVLMGQLEVVKCLIEKDVDIDLVNRAERTALHFAVLKGFEDIVEYLVTAGINVTATDDDGKTALVIAEERKQGKKIIEFLRNTEKNIKRLSPKSTEELSLHELAKNGDVEKIYELLKIVDIETRNKDNNTILHIASYYGHESLVKYLLDRGANTDATNKINRIPLHLASQRGHVKVVKHLLDKDHKSTARDKWGLTPLHRAAYKGHKEVVTLLLDAGSSPSSQDYRNQTPLHGAANQGHNDLIDLLISKGANVEAVCDDKKTCLHEAAKNGKTEAVRHLVKFFKNIINNATTEGETALHIAAKYGYLPVVQELVAAKADVNITNNSKKTALDLAVKYSKTEIVKFLQNYKGKSN